MKVILTIAAGRRLSMTGLIPQLLAQEGWDELHVWVNTKDKDDLAFLGELPKLDPRIQLKFLQARDPVQVEGGYFQESRKAENLGDWWPANCTDPDAIYVRFDDDIVFVEQGTVKALVEARLKYPEPYLIFPVIINNAIMAHFLEAAGKLTHPEGKSYTPYVFDPLIWNASMCFDIHQQFLNKAKELGVEHFHIPDREIEPQHISINCMAYFGKDIAAWGGEFGVNGEEGFITCQVPYWNKRKLMILGSKVVSHMAFAPQRKWWESQSDDPEVDEYIKQIKNFGRALDNLEDKFRTNFLFNKEVSDKVNFHNQAIEILEGYRALHGDLYGIEGYPVVHKTWNWQEILSDIEKFKQSL